MSQKRPSWRDEVARVLNNDNDNVQSVSTRTQKGVTVPAYGQHTLHTDSFASLSLWTKNCSSTYKVDARSAGHCAATTFSSI